MSSTNSTRHRVDLKREPCRVCNTSHQQTIDILQNKKVLDSLTTALDLMIFPDSRLSKRICGVCLALVRFFSDFKKICYDTQNDLWQMDPNLVQDRSEEVCQILNKVKQVSTYKSPPVVKPDGTVKQPKIRPKPTKTLDHHTNETPIQPSPKVLYQHRIINQRGQIEAENQLITNEPELMEDESELVEDESELLEEEQEVDNNFINTEQIQKDFTEVFDIETNDLDDSEGELKDHRLFDTKQIQNSNKEASSPTNSMDLDVLDVSNQISQHNQLPKILYQCQQCNKSFLKLQELTDHRKSHPTPTGQKCGYCRVEFPVDTIANHVIQCALLNKRKKQNSSPVVETMEIVKPQTVFIKPDLKLIKCSVCGERFQSLTECKTHLQEHKNT